MDARERTLLAVFAQALMADPLRYIQYIEILKSSGNSEGWFEIINWTFDNFHKFLTKEEILKWAIETDQTDHGAMKEFARALIRAQENRERVEKLYVAKI